MKLDLFASITVSLAVHVGAAVVVGGWLERMPAGAPASVPGIEEVILEFSGGDETADNVSTATAAPSQDQPQIASAPPEKSDDALSAPILAEAPREIGPPQKATTPAKVIEQTPIRDTSKKQPGNPALKSRGTSSQTSSGGGSTSAEYRSRASLSYPASALRVKRAGASYCQWN